MRHDRSAEANSRKLMVHQAASEEHRPKPRVYIAAPFSSMQRAIAPAERYCQSGHGVIEPGAYRHALTLIAETFRSIGLEDVLPHRDINRWGYVNLGPARISSECAHQVRSCQLFAGVLGESCGAHFEFGLAVAFGLPCLLISAADVPESFLARGLNTPECSLTRNRNAILRVRVDSLDEAASALKSIPVLKFIHRQTRIVLRRQAMTI